MRLYHIHYMPRDDSGTYRINAAPCGYSLRVYTTTPPGLTSQNTLTSHRNYVTCPSCRTWVKGGPS